MTAFTARTVTGAGRGKALTYPTINVDLRDVPKTISDGIYAAWARLPGEAHWRPAAVHIGPRPVFRDDRAVELHLLDDTIEYLPERVTISLLEPKIRNVQDFPSVDALKTAIAEDIFLARAMLSTHVPGDQGTHRS